MLVLGCGGNTQPGTSAGPSDDVARTGAAAPEGLAAQRDALRQRVMESGQVVDLDAIAHQPLVTGEVVVDHLEHGFSAKLDVSVVNAGRDTLSAIAFTLPLAARVHVSAVAVDGRSIAAPSNAGRWSVPVTLAPGARTTIHYELAGALSAPAVPAEVAGPLTLPPSARVAALDVVGSVDGVTLLTGFVPRVDGEPRMTTALDVVAMVDTMAFATGVETRRVKRGDATSTTFVAPDVADVGVVVVHDLAQSRVEVGALAVVSLHPTSQGEGSERLVGDVRRAIEGAEGMWGPAPLGELRVVPYAALAGRGVMSLPGFVLVPPSALASDAPKLHDDPLGAVLAHYPVARDALRVAVSAAVAGQWWLGRGADASATRLLEDGVPLAAALQIVGGQGDDKAERRARMLTLELPYLDARGSSPLNPTDRTTIGAEPVLTRTPEDAGAAAKAGLAADTLRHHLGAQLYAEALKPLVARATITTDELRAALLAKSPRAAETQALLARWLDEAHADEDVEAPSVATLLEYFAVDGLIGAGKELLVDELAQRPDLIGKGIDALGQGATPGLALQLLDELTGPKDPQVQKWLDVAKGLLGQQREQALDTLVDELGQDIGIPDAERTRLRMMAGLALRALRGDTAPAPEEPVPELELRPTAPDTSP